MHRDITDGHEHSSGAGSGSWPAGPAEARPRPWRLGIGGPVGSGKTALVAALCERLRGVVPVGVVTNDIYTTEDADTLRRLGVLDAKLIRAVRTGCCPHTAIRDDIGANLDAVDELGQEIGAEGVILIESGGDNLTATFSYGLIDRQIFVLDVAGGDNVARKGGPGVTRSDLLVVNKVDLAPMVGADVDRMLADAAEVRDGRPVIPTTVRNGEGVDEVVRWMMAELVLAKL